MIYWKFSATENVLINLCIRRFHYLEFSYALKKKNYTSFTAPFTSVTTERSTAELSILTFVAWRFIRRMTLLASLQPIQQPRISMWIHFVQIISSIIMPSTVDKLIKLINYWWFRYLMVTELYIVEKWERVIIRTYTSRATTRKQNSVGDEFRKQYFQISYFCCSSWCSGISTWASFSHWPANF